MPLKQFSSKHKLAIRWFHWVNFPVLFLMIWSGTLIYWANSVYKLDAGIFTFKFYPPSVYQTLNIPHRLAEGMSIHFVLMWVFLINGFLYVLYLALSGEWRTLLPTKTSWRDAFLVVLHDLHLRKSAPAHNKYNAAQRIAYTMIIVMGFLSLLSGLVIYKPATFPNLTTFMGGYENGRFIHFALTIGFLLFFVVHIVQVILAGWNNFRAMITGWEIISINPKEIPTVDQPTIDPNQPLEKKADETK